MAFLLFYFVSFFQVSLENHYSSTSFDNVDQWVKSQVEVLKKGKTHTPPEQLETLFNHVFLTKMVTSDVTTLPSDWGRVTGDGVSVDPWDLADRMHAIGQQLHWRVSLSECGLGPVLMMGDGDKRVGALLVHGAHGHWARWYPDRDLPLALSDKNWQKVLHARQSLLMDRGSLEISINEAVSPTLAHYLLRFKPKSVSLHLLESWCHKWPEIDYFLIECLSRSRLQGEDKRFDKLWQSYGVNSNNHQVLLEGALWMKQKNQIDQAKALLEKIIRQNPHHYKALMFQRKWEP